MSSPITTASASSPSVSFATTTDAPALQPFTLLYKDVFSCLPQFLSVRECLGVKRVSKQFNQLILTKQFPHTNISWLGSNLADGSQLSKEHLISLLKTAKASGCKIKSLSLSCLELRNQDIEKILEHCPHLHTLTINSCFSRNENEYLNQLAPEVFEGEVNTGIIAIGKACPHLETLIIRASPLTNASLVFIAKCLPNLQTFDVENCFNITDDGLEALAAIGSKIHSLNIKGCNITKAGLEALTPIGPNFQALGLAGNWIGAAELANLSQNMPNLQRLQLTTGPFEAKELIAYGQTFPHLQELTVSGLSADDELMALGEMCPQLNFLHLLNCKNMTDIGLAGLGKICTKLHTVYLHEHPFKSTITDEGLAALVKNCPNLHKLTLANCKNITDAGIAALQAQWPLLEIKRLK